MAYDLSTKLVIGIASSALFDLSESDAVFRDRGITAYREHQAERLEEPLVPGVAYPFIRRLLSLNDLADDPSDPLVEVIVLSRNSADTGRRIMRSVEHHSLPITRAAFTEGKAPYEYMGAFNMSLFLSAHKASVDEAIALGLPAGQVLTSTFEDDPSDPVLRIAFDFDGVIADDASEQVFAESDLESFQEHETANLTTPHEAGPLKDLLAKINKIQRIEEARQVANPDYLPRLRVALVTARNAPAHERAINSLNAWGLTINDAFFLGGVEKPAVLEVLSPHIYFDDQQAHLTSKNVPSVHIPFGIRNKT